MSKLSITAAAKAAGISRQTMYKKYINHGLISVETVNDIKQIDTSELLRVFGSLQLIDDNDSQDATEQDTSVYNASSDIIQLLKEQLSESREREKWLMQQLEKTTHLLENKAEEKEKKQKKIFGIF